MRASLRLVLSVLVGIAACVAASVFMAVLLAIVDLYLSGHGLPALSRPWIAGDFVQLSRADALLLGAAGCVGLVAGVVFHRFGGKRGAHNSPS